MEQTPTQDLIEALTSILDLRRLKLVNNIQGPLVEAAIKSCSFELHSVLFLKNIFEINEEDALYITRAVKDDVPIIKAVEHIFKTP